MSRFVALEQCPRCAERGRDRRGDNLAVYNDNSKHCFSCGWHQGPSFRLKFLNKEPEDVHQKAVLPSDFTREIPAAGWKWLLQYGLSMSYWKAYCGYSEKANRLIICHGTPTYLSVGRYIGDVVGTSKWKIYGDKTQHVETLGRQLSKEVVLVEDLVSAHKVAQVTSSIPLFGTAIFDGVVKELRSLGRPVTLWLDEDQYTHLPRKIGRLQALLNVPVRHIRTTKDPKDYTLDEIKEILQ